MGTLAALGGEASPEHWLSRWSWTSPPPSSAVTDASRTGALGREARETPAPAGGREAARERGPEGAVSSMATRRRDGAGGAEPIRFPRTARGFPRCGLLASFWSFCARGEQGGGYLGH